MSSSRRIPFHKMNGLGNQIVVVDARAGGLSFGSAQACALAAHPATPFDQLMLLEPPKTPGTAAFVRIYNNDGSPAGACGNGMRCVGLVARGAVSQAPAGLKFETAAGLLDVTFPDADTITVDMGPPRFAWNEIPLSEEFHDTIQIELQVGPIDAPVLHSPSVCSMGNPHAVFWVDNVETQALEKFGPMLEHHPLFPERANITVASVSSPTRVRTRTWERGAGLTRACGSAACAVLACGVRTGRLARRAVVSVPGGDLTIAWPEGAGILMSGPAEHEYEGALVVGADGALTIEA
jgi:diaminopimelate epimerase